MTIRKTSKTQGISECVIRSLVAQGKCPGFRSGNRFIVNVDALMQMLEGMQGDQLNGEDTNKNH